MGTLRISPAEEEDLPEGSEADSPSPKNQPARILLTNFHPGEGGGHLTYIRNIATSYLARQYDLAIGSPATSGIIRMARERGLKHIELDFPGSLREMKDVVVSVRRLNKAYHRFPFDIIHTNGSRDHWIAAYWKLFYRKPTALVRTRHASNRTGNDWIHRTLNNRLTKANIFVSHAAKRMGESDGGLQFANGIVIPNGVDVDHFSPASRDNELASTLGISSNDFVFGSVAGLGHYKRVDLFLEALAGLTLPRNVKVVVLGGEGPARRLIRMASEMGLGEGFIYAGHHRDVRPFIALFDVGFLMSDSIENMSYASREMMAMGVPMISSNYCGLVENVDHGINGFLVNPGNLEEIRSAITRFATMSQPELKGYSEAARQKAEGAFSTKAQFQLLSELYDRILLSLRSPSKWGHP